MNKFVLHLNAYGKDWYVTKQKAKLPSTASTISHKSARGGVRMVKDQRRAMKFSSYEAAARHWTRLVKITGIRGWVVLPVSVRETARKNPSAKGSGVRGERAKQMLSFARKYPGWHSTAMPRSPDYARSLKVAQQLHAKGLIELTIPYPDGSRQFRATAYALKNPAKHKAGSADKVAAKELILFIENDGQLYRSRTTPIMQNLQKKFRKGTYNLKLAAKLWGYLADDGAKKYAKEVGGEAAGWNRMFSTATRRLVARTLASSHLAEMRAGNFQA